MPQKISPIWDYFVEDEKEPSYVICQIVGCKKKRISRGKGDKSKGKLTNSSMVSHLNVHHSMEFAEFQKKRADKEASTKATNEDDDDEMEVSTVPLFQLRSQKQRQIFLQQSTITSWVGSSQRPVQSSGSMYDIHDIRAKERHKGVLMMVVLDLQPWTIVENAGFNYYSYQMDPHYKLGSINFYRSLLDKSYNNNVKKVMEKISVDQPMFVACQLDGWSCYKHGYMGLLISYLTPGWKRVSICLNCSPFDQSHTGEHIAEWLDTKLSSWSVLDKTNVVISDSASNMLKSMDYLPNSMEHINCLNHVLQLSINDEVFLKLELKNINGKIKSFLNYHSSSNLLNSALEERQKECGFETFKQPIQDVKTRWNTTYDSWSRFLELKEPINLILDDRHWKEKLKVKFSSYDWKVMENVVKVLQPFKEATLELSKGSSCISSSIPTVASIFHALDQIPHESDTGVRDLMRRLKENLSNRLSGMEDRDVYALATLLDPRYKEVFFRSHESRNNSKNRLISLLQGEVPYPDIGNEELIEVNNDSSIKKSSLAAAYEALKEKSRSLSGNRHVGNETAKDVVEDYLKADLVESKPLAWWASFSVANKDNALKQGLCNLARKFLTPSPTSTNCERLFSVAGQILDEKRSSMLPDNLEKLLFLRENILNTNFSLDW